MAEDFANFGRVDILDCFEDEPEHFIGESESRETVRCNAVGLYRPEIIEAVANVLADKLPDVPVVLDPVMIATSGAQLIEDAAVQALVEHLLPSVDLLTPNAPEAAALSGRLVETIDDAATAARSMRDMGARAILMKGGHLGGDTVIDLLFEGDDQSMRFAGPRIDSRNTHGTGCTLASACAAGLAQGLSLGVAVGRAHHYVRAAIETAPGYGAGYGPINHAHTIRAD